MKKAVRMAVAAGMCAALALSAGCQKKTVADDEVQRYAWPLATASPEDTVTQIYAEKFAEEVEELKLEDPVEVFAQFFENMQARPMSEAEKRVMTEIFAKAAEGEANG